MYSFGTEESIRGIHREEVGLEIPMNCKNNNRTHEQGLLDDSYKVFFIKKSNTYTIDWIWYFTHDSLVPFLPRWY